MFHQHIEQPMVIGGRAQFAGSAGVGVEQDMRSAELGKFLEVAAHLVPVTLTGEAVLIVEWVIGEPQRKPRRGAVGGHRARVAGACVG
jgi:hypothetical protein